jgi:hypothetical protein
MKIKTDEEIAEMKKKIRPMVDVCYPATINVQLDTSVQSIEYHMRMLRETEEYLHRLSKNTGIREREFELSEKRIHNALEVLEEVRAEKMYEMAMSDNDGFWITTQFKDGFVRRYFEKAFDKERLNLVDLK